MISPDQNVTFLCKLKIRITAFFVQAVHENTSVFQLLGLMQVSTDLLIWNDAHMQSRLKIRTVALFTGKFVKFKFPVVLKFTSILITTFGTSLTPGNNNIVMS